MSFRFFQLSFCVLLLVCCGCNSGATDVGAVEGVVTLDGQPVDGATIRFFPTTGRPSLGFTDNRGHYSLTYTRKQKGALIGGHKVTISTKQEADYMDADAKGRKESLPRKFYDKDKTELTASVEAGQNKIDFELRSADF